MTLIDVEGYEFPVAASSSVGPERTADLAQLAARALRWHCEQLGWQPELRQLTIADEQDWSDVAEVPIYGVPQTFTDRVTVAAGNAPLFDEVAAVLTAHAPPAVKTELAECYGDPPSLLGNFDLFLVHELVHLFGEQRPSPPAPLWAVELVCNLGMVGFVREVEPARLPTLLTAIRAWRHVPLDLIEWTALDDMERSFQAGPINFGWYIDTLVDLADHLWTTDGSALYRSLYELLHPAAGPGSPAAAIGRSDLEALSPALSRAVASWPTIPR